MNYMFSVAESKDYKQNRNDIRGVFQTDQVCSCIYLGEKGTMNETLIFFKIVSLTFNSSKEFSNVWSTCTIASLICCEAVSLYFF